MSPGNLNAVDKISLGNIRDKLFDEGCQQEAIDETGQKWSTTLAAVTRSFEKLYLAYKGIQWDSFLSYGNISKQKGRAGGPLTTLRCVSKHIVT